MRRQPSASGLFRLAIRSHLYVRRTPQQSRRARHRRLPSLVTLPLESASGLYQIPFGPQHPFVAAIGAVSGSSRLSAVMSTLEKFFWQFRPKTIAEYVGATSSPRLGKFPAFAYVAPWWNSVPTERVRVKQNAYFVDGVWVGWKNSGPATEELIRSEAERLIAVDQSIRSHGYRRARGRDGDVRAEWLLSSNHPPRWLIQHGDHRAAAAFSHGLTSVPVRITGCVRERDAPSWPNVRNGLWSLDDALGFFRRVARGGMPPLAEGWPTS